MTGPTDPPVFDPADAAPMPPEPADGQCPHCGAAWTSKGTAAKLDDAAVCMHCAGLVIREPDGWRAPTFDEAEQWDRDARIIAMRRIWAKDDPGPGTETPP